MGEKRRRPETQIRPSTGPWVSAVIWPFPLLPFPFRQQTLGLTAFLRFVESDGSCSTGDHSPREVDSHDSGAVWIIWVCGEEETVGDHQTRPDEIKDWTSLTLGACKVVHFHMASWWALR